MTNHAKLKSKALLDANGNLIQDFSNVVRYGNTAHASSVDAQYMNLAHRILNEGTDSASRTGVDCRALACETIKIDMNGNGDTDRVPLLLSKFVHYPSIVHELIWFLSGDTNIRYLQENGVSIWDEWADDAGNLGPVYGAQWRGFDGVDQIRSLEETLRTNPFDRRMVVSAWNPAELQSMALPPCHYTWAVTVTNGQWGERLLHLHMTQRSADVFLGVPFNIASYATLLLMLCRVHGFTPGFLSISFVNAHLYRNHFEQTQQMLNDGYKLLNAYGSHGLQYPRLNLNFGGRTVDSVLDIDFSMFGFDDDSPYLYGRRIKAPVAV